MLSRKVFSETWPQAPFFPSFLLRQKIVVLPPSFRFHQKLSKGGVKNFMIQIFNGKLYNVFCKFHITLLLPQIEVLPH